MNLYVGNLSYTTSEEELKEVFSTFGEVISAKIVLDRETGRSKGFGFVEMAESGAGRKAAAALDGTELSGRMVKVSEARPPKSREERGGLRGSRESSGA